MGVLRSVGGVSQVASRPALTIPFVAASNDLERRIAALWQAALGMDQIGIDDPIFELGGDSVLANQVLVEVNRVLGISVAAAVHEADFAGLGVDVERRSRVSPALMSRLARPDEAGVVEHLDTLTQGDAPTAVFGLKEAIYKCAFPTVGRIFGFQAVRLSLGAVPWTFRAQVLLEVRGRTPSLDACLRVTPKHVFSGAWMQPGG